MTDVTQGNTASFTLAAGEQVYIKTAGAAVVKYGRLLPKSPSVVQLTSADSEVRYGPYPVEMLFEVSATTGTLTYSDSATVIQRLPDDGSDLSAKFNAVADALGSGTGGMTPAEIGVAVSGAGSAPCSAGALMAKITNDSEDGIVFVCSDSTGNDSYEWVYLYAQWIASLSSKITVKYYKWNISSNDYDAAETISTGVGGNGNTISIYNAAIPGSRISYLTGSKYDKAVGALPFIDLIILNHGHNHVTQYATSINSIEYARTKQFHDALSVFQRRANNAGVMVLSQNPYRDDDNYAIMYATLNKFAESVNADVADSYSKFVAEEKNPALYIDNAHPSAEGSELFLAAVKQRHSSTTPKGANLAERPSGVNILPNGGFELFAGSVPDEWTQTNATTTKELTITKSLNGYSVKIEKTAGGSSSYISQNLSAAALKHVKGRYITLNVRMYIPNGAVGSTGRISLLTNTSATNTTALNDDNQGGWISKSISVFVKDTDTYVTALIYSDSSTGTSSTLYVDSAALTIGAFPASLS